MCYGEATGPCRELAPEQCPGRWWFVHRWFFFFLLSDVVVFLLLSQRDRLDDQPHL